MLQDIKRLGKSGLKFRHGGGGYQKWPKKSDVFYGRPLTNNCLQHLFFQSHIFGKTAELCNFNISKIKASYPLSNIYNRCHFKWEFLTRIKSNEDTYLVFHFESQFLIRNHSVKFKVLYAYYPKSKKNELDEVIFLCLRNQIPQKRYSTEIRDDPMLKNVTPEKGNLVSN